jgi:hypothetical protein
MLGLLADWAIRGFGEPADYPKTGIEAVLLSSFNPPKKCET